MDESLPLAAVIRNCSSVQGLHMDNQIYIKHMFHPEFKIWCHPSNIFKCSVELENGLHESENYKKNIYSERVLVYKWKDLRLETAFSQFVISQYFLPLVVTAVAGGGWWELLPECPSIGSAVWGTESAVWRGGRSNIYWVNSINFINHLLEPTSFPAFYLLLQNIHMLSQPVLFILSAFMRGEHIDRLSRGFLTACFVKPEMFLPTGFL